MNAIADESPADIDSKYSYSYTNSENSYSYIASDNNDASEDDSHEDNANKGESAANDFSNRPSHNRDNNGTSPNIVRRADETPADDSDVDVESTYSYEFDEDSDSVDENFDRSDDMACFDGLMVDPPDISASSASAFNTQLRCAATPSVNAGLDTTAEDDTAPRISSDLFLSLQVPDYEDYWMLHRSEIGKQDTDKQQLLGSMLQNFRSYLESDVFINSCKHCGLVDATFAWKEPAAALSSAFLQEGLSSLQTAQANIGLVFHGTPENNIDSILQVGLDPGRRKGQAYGPGEYFGKDPGVSLSYCRGGRQMLVFCVVALPPDPSRTLPPGFVVVQQTSLQLPLGILKFTSASQASIARSLALQVQLQQLNQEARRQESLAKEAELKAEIIRILIQGEAELAGTYFKKVSGQFSDASKKEIGFYAYQRMDAVFVEDIFDGSLPPPSDCSWDSLSNKIRSVEEQQKAAAEARQKVDKTLSKITMLP